MSNQLTSFLKRLKKYWHDADAQDLVEYALLLLVVALGAVASVKSLGQSVSSVFASTNTQIATGTTATAAATGATVTGDQAAAAADQAAENNYNNLSNADQGNRSAAGQDYAQAAADEGIAQGLEQAAAFAAQFGIIGGPLGANALAADAVAATTAAQQEAAVAAQATSAVTTTTRGGNNGFGIGF